MAKTSQIASVILIKPKTGIRAAIFIQSLDLVFGSRAGYVTIIKQNTQLLTQEITQGVIGGITNPAHFLYGGPHDSTGSSKNMREFLFLPLGKRMEFHVVWVVGFHFF